MSKREGQDDDSTVVDEDTPKRPSFTGQVRVGKTASLRGQKQVYYSYVHVICPLTGTYFQIKKKNIKKRK